MSCERPPLAAVLHRMSRANGGFFFVCPLGCVYTMEPEANYNLSDLLSPAKTLSDATPDELFEALKQKVPGCIAAWIEPNTDGTDVYCARYGGAWATAIGLSRYLKKWIDGELKRE